MVVTELHGALVFYVDEHLLLACANGVLDYLLLWATAAVTRVYSNRLRLALAAFCGTIYYLCHVLALYGLIPHYGPLGMWAALLSVSLLMLLIAFAPLSWGKLRMVTAHFYLIGFVSAGTGLAGMYTLSRPGFPSPFVGLGIAVVFLLLTAQLGWGVLQRRSWRQGLQLPIDIVWEGKRARITALLDTGNQLREPLLGAPVLIAERRALERLLPQEVSVLAAQTETADSNTLYVALQALPLKNRICLIPYHGVGNSRGMLLGFRPDAVTLWLDHQEYRTSRCIVALATHPLDPRGIYQGLIGPHLLEEAVGGPPVSRADIPQHPPKEEIPHAVT